MSPCEPNCLPTRYFPHLLRIRTTAVVVREDLMTKVALARSASERWARSRAWPSDESWIDAWIAYRRGMDFTEFIIFFTFYSLFPPLLLLSLLSPPSFLFSLFFALSISPTSPVARRGHDGRVTQSFLNSAGARNFDVDVDVDAEVFSSCFITYLPKVPCSSLTFRYTYIYTYPFLLCKSFRVRSRLVCWCGAASQRASQPASTPLMAHVESGFRKWRDYATYTWKYT